MATDIRPLLDHVPAWLMVLFRLTGIFILAPLFGSQTIPRQVKVYLVVALSFCVYPMLLDPGKPSAAMIHHIIDQKLYFWLLIARVGLELAIGFGIGYLASLPLIGMQMGGHVMGQQMGMALARDVNPESGAESAVVGEFFFMLALAVFLIMGGHHAILATLVGSYDHVPLGAFQEFGSLLTVVVGMISTTFELALRISAPMVCLMFLQSFTLGFIARTVPQMNILSVGFAIRILAGASCMLMLFSTVSRTYSDVLMFCLRRIMGFFAM